VVAVPEKATKERLYLLMKQDYVGPNDEVHEHVDPIFDETNRHLPKMFDILTNVLTYEEAGALEAFAKRKLATESEDLDTNQTLELPYRTDEWDGDGVIAKIQELAKQHIQNTYSLAGYLEPRKFMLMRTENAQSYKETYSEYNKNGEVLYTAIATPSSPAEYYSGETRYTVNGEGFRPSSRDVVVHRNEEMNNWEMVEVVTGVRFDLIIVFQEINKQVSYDYEIDQTIAEGLTSF